MILNLLSYGYQSSNECHVRLFATIDSNNNGLLSAFELKAFIIGIRCYEIEYDKDDAVEMVMREFDTSNNRQIDVWEFVAGVSSWLREAMHNGDMNVDHGSRTQKVLSDFHTVSFVCMNC